VVDPADARAVTFALTLSEPFTGTLTVEGASVPVTLRPGQTARLVFEATAGQRISLGVSEVRFGTGNHVVITVVKPDGTTLLSRILGTNGGVIDFDPLPDTGTYTIVADPQASSLNPGATTASLTVTLAGR
jgi:hypothetical protein